MHLTSLQLICQRFFSYGEEHYLLNYLLYLFKLPGKSLICQYNFLNLYWGKKSLRKKKKNAFLVLEEKFGKKNDKLVRRKVDVTRATGMSLK